MHYVDSFANAVTMGYISLKQNSDYACHDRLSNTLLLTEVKRVHFLPIRSVSFATPNPMISLLWSNFKSFMCRNGNMRRSRRYFVFWIAFPVSFQMLSSALAVK